MGVTKEEVVHLYVKAGVDGTRLGACPFCQRVQMVMIVKENAGLLKFKLILANPSKPPDELKRMGLKHLPAIIHGDEGFDTEDDIVNYLDEKFPGGDLNYESSEADVACKDFFSKFCFFIKAVSSDSSKLERALEKFNAFLESTSPPSSLATNSPPPTSPTSPIPPSPKSPLSSPSTCSPLSASPIHSPTPAFLPNSTTNWPVVNCASKSLGSGATSPPVVEQADEFLCGPSLCHLDCEVLPKLQHLRVASQTMKQFTIPAKLQGIWRYLHTAYSNSVFIQTCPCDQEIILHWHDRPETQKLSHKKHSQISKEKAKFSFDVPARASVVTVVEIP